MFERATVSCVSLIFFVPQFFLCFFFLCFVSFLVVRSFLVVSLFVVFFVLFVWGFFCWFFYSAFFSVPISFGVSVCVILFAKICMLRERENDGGRMFSVCSSFLSSFVKKEIESSSGVQLQL